jgi:hypothetical protein
VTAHEDHELIDWLLNASSGAGDFLRSLAEAGLRADGENYPVLRPVLVKMKAKFPKYAEPKGG